MKKSPRCSGPGSRKLARLFRNGFLLAVAAAAVSRGFGAPSDEGSPSSSRITFSLLPKAFQKDPPVHMTVITETTVDGGKLKPPTAAKPMYYLSHTVGYHDEGQSYGEKKIIPPEKLQAYLEKSLAENHFLPADAAHPASLMMIFSWGSANKLDNRTDSMIDVSPPASVTVGALGEATTDTGTSTYFEEPADIMSYDYATRQNFLARAQLVGGVKFAHELAETFKQADYLHDGSSIISGLSPLELLEDRDPLARQLVEETMDDCYYVVVSAYDAYALAHGHRRLLWQSKMTTNSAGISMVETLPALIKSGAPYFGRLMSQPTILQGHLERQGHVELGLPMVVPDQSTTQRTEPAK
jgi:hypothetical protein